MASPISVGLVCPTPVEFKPCCQRLRLSRRFDVFGRPVESRKANTVTRIALCSGPGKAAAESGTRILIDRFRPDVIIDVGAAGSLVDRIRIGAIVCGAKSIEFGENPMMPSSDAAGKQTSSTMCDTIDDVAVQTMLRFGEWVKQSASTDFVVGPIASPDNVVDDPILRKHLHERSGALACTLETSAVLKTAAQNRIPALSFRVVTDTASGNVAREFVANRRKALDGLFRVVEEFFSGGWLKKIMPDRKQP